MGRTCSKNGSGKSSWKIVFECKPDGRRRMARPRLRWLEDGDRRP